MGLLLFIFGSTLASFFIFILVRAAWITISCYYLEPRRIRKTMLKQGVSGPKPRFLVGNLPDIASLVARTTSSDMESVDHDIVGRLLPHYVLWSKIYGKRFIYWYGSEPRFILTDTDMIKEFFSSKCAQLSGRSWLQKEGTKNFIGEGVLMANSTNWFHQRHTVAPAFMGDKLKSHLVYMVSCAKQTIASLHEAARTGNNEVEIGEYMTRLTGDIICHTEFDSSYEKGKKLFHLLNHMQKITAQSSRYLWIPGSRYFPNKFRSEIKAMKMEVDKLLMEIIQSRKDGVEFGRSSSFGKGLLGMLLAETQRKMEGFRYSLQLVMDECKTFIFAGHETSSLLLTWTIMLLATNPSWQEKARAEVAEVCGDEPPSPDHLSRLNLLHMIINESLRLYPPVSLLPRMVFEDIKLGELHIPKGLSVWIPVLAIHHSKEIWGEDANKFNPERFAAKSFALTRHFLPFAAGPRNCVGQAYAMMEAKTVLAIFLSNFSFTISENYRHAPVNVLTLKPKYGVPIYLKPLRH